MSTARPHILTLLFLFATTCLDVAICPWGMDDADFRSVTTGFLIGQMFAVGGWLVLGRPHRLLRGAVFVAVVIALATIITFSVNGGSGFVEEWGRIFAVVSLFAAIPAAAAGLVKVMAWRVSAHRDRSAAGDVRFPLVEIFGWMIVVAVASAVLRFADFAELTSPASELVLLLASSGVAGVVYALLHNWRAPLRGLRLAASVVLFVLFEAFGATQLRQPEMPIMFAWAFAYVGAWLIVQWIVQTAVPEEVAPPLEQIAIDSPWDSAVEASVDVNSPG